MKKIKYLYLDDNDKVTRDGDVELINTISSHIEIVTDYPCSWAQRSKQILLEIESFDGIILDWDLTNQSEQAKQGTEQAETVDFSAESLAEHLRVTSARDKTKDIPIILCSADKNKEFTKLRSKEQTSRDLFDLTFIKNDLFVKHVDTADAQLCDLATVYQHLQNKKFNLLGLLQISEEELGSIDIRFTDSLETIANTKTTHDLIYFLLSELIENEGILINEFVLGARLGVDIEASNSEWHILKAILIKENIIYAGLLSGGWECYWAFKLDRWWQAHIEKNDLRTTDASERVRLLNEVLKLNLVAAAKIKFCSSGEYWTVCRGLNRPLDPLNGFMIGSNVCNPWLEIQYVSGLAELEKTDSEAWKINVMDRERFNYFKTIISAKS